LRERRGECFDGGRADDDAGWLLGTDEAICTEGERGGGAAGEVERVDGVAKAEGRRPKAGGSWCLRLVFRISAFGIRAFPQGHRFGDEGLGDRDFVDAVFGEGDADGVAESVEEETADADGAFDAAVFAVARFGDAEVERVVHVFLRHALHEQAVGLDHDLGIRGLHREHDLLVGVRLGDAEELEGALDHTERRVAVAVHDAVAQRAVIGADAEGAAEGFGAEDERSERVVEALEFDVVVGIRVLADGEFLFVGVVARIDADFFHVLDGLHRGGGEEMDVGDERNVAKAGGGKLLADGFEALRGGDVGRGDADDFTAHFCESDGLFDGGGDVLRVARGHRLHADGMRAADADGADHDFMGGAADGVEARGAVGHAENPKDEGRMTKGGGRKRKEMTNGQ
jgi:hypothetical protein